MRISKSAGWTLVEMMVAIGVLAAVSVPIIMLYTYSTRLAAAAHRQTIAAVLAQQRIEELIGLTEADLLLEYAEPPLEVRSLTVMLAGAPEPAYDDQTDFLNQLAKVTVQVFYDLAEAPLVEQTVIIALAES
jgi:type II secretory pathway pseudopilin PulG